MAAIDDLISGWSYEYDERLDNWEILAPGPGGIYRGDCDDFACTALYLLVGESLVQFWLALLTRRAKIHFVRISDEGHAVLEFDGQYIDNIQREFCTREQLETWSFPYEFRFRCPLPFIALKMALGKIKRVYDGDRRRN